MKFDEALNIAKNHYKWHIISNVSMPDNSRELIVLEYQRTLTLTDKQVIEIAKDVHVTSLFAEDQ